MSDDINHLVPEKIDMLLFVKGFDNIERSKYKPDQIEVSVQGANYESVLDHIKITPSALRYIGVDLILDTLTTEEIVSYLRKNKDIIFLGKDS